MMMFRRWVMVVVAAVAAGVVSVVTAETIVVGDSVAVRESAVERPTRGMSMESVEAKFGAPVRRHAPVGEPPITRWDYPEFSVFFEYRHVIHAVVTSQRVADSQQQSSSSP